MTFHNRARILVVTAAVSLASITALAEQVKLKAVLSGANEVPAKDTKGTGVVTGTLDTETNHIQYHVVYEGLTGPATAAHFHGPAAEGVNAKPQVPVKAPFESPIEGEATISAEQAKDLLDGKWYFNLHTAANPGGEIRGQVVKDQ